LRTPRSLAGWTIAVFGALALIMGGVGLVAPGLLLSMLGFEPPAARTPGDHTLVFVIAASMASFNMGVYYLLAAATEWRPFFVFTVFFRMVTVVVFTTAVVAGPAPVRFLGVALWEGLGAIATGFALAWDARRAQAAVAYASDVGR
jgi:hypothetical protein